MLFALLQFCSYYLSLLIYSLAPHFLILRLNPLMAVKEIAFVFACWLYFASATFCINDNDCGLLETCCEDSVCRQTCYYCYYNYQCGTGECCWSGDCQKKCSDGKCRKNCDSCSYNWQCDSDECCDSADDTCKLVCTHSLTNAAVAGIVTSCLVVAAIVISIVACCCCACCPCYRTRHPGTVVVTQPMGGFITTTQSTQETIQEPPYGGYNPLPPGYNPPPAGYNPPPFGASWIPQASGVPSYPPRQAGEPFKTIQVVERFAFSVRSLTF